MHEEGFKKALTNVVNKYARGKSLLKEKDDNLLGEDIREGLTAIVSVKLRDPQFEGQTKAKLGNVSMRSLVEKATNEKLGRVARGASRPRRSRSSRRRSQRGAGTRRGASGARPHPAQVRARGRGHARQARRLLARATADEAELFIVEGDSAGGSAMNARNPRTQAILPIRGKILNVERARIDKMLENTEIQTLITAIGAGIGDEFDVAKVRYGKVIILADADVDGSHIRTLLLTFFYRQMTAARRARATCTSRSRRCTPSRSARTKVVPQGRRGEGCVPRRPPEPQKEFQRLKGLGEMDWHELRETCMDPRTRTLVQINVEQAAIADEMLSRAHG